jgi:parallel beta-helix repeat protein
MILYDNLEGVNRGEMSYPTSLNEKSDILSEERGMLKASGFWDLPYIHVDNNWSQTASIYNWCSGSGSWSDPYIIENVTIDDFISRPAIEIENSNDYFIIRNCTSLLSTGSFTYPGFVIRDSSNGTIHNNSIRVSDWYGIYLRNSNNITIYDNYLNQNRGDAIYLSNSDSNKIFQNRVIDGFNQDGISLDSGSDWNSITNNTINTNDGRGIHIISSDHNLVMNNTIGTIDTYEMYIRTSYNITISDNKMTRGGIRVTDTYSDMSSHSISANNTVNGKPIYYYVDEKNLNDGNFTNAGQVILINCSDSVIRNLIFADLEMGIALFHNSNNVSIINNTMDTIPYGIYLNNGNIGNLIKNNTVWNSYIQFVVGASIYLGTNCDNNTITDNNLYFNERGLYLTNDCDYNNITNNIIRDNEEQGIRININSDFNDINNNLVLNNSNNGIEIDSSLKSSLINNSITNNRVNGIYVSLSNNFTILNNSFESNWNYALYISSSNDNLIRINSFINSSNTIYYEGAPTGNIENFNYYEGRFGPSFIDNNGGTPGAFTWDELTEYWFISGSGAKIDPFLLENLIFDGFDIANSLMIRDTSTFFTIQNNWFTNSSTAESGLLLINMSDGVILSNNFTDNGGTGFRIRDNSTRLLIFNNNISSNTREGLEILNNCDNNTLIQNIASTNGDDGIVLKTYSNFNNITGNIANGNSGASGGTGIVVTDFSYNNSISNNTLINNGYNGILVGANCDNLTIFNNVIIDTGTSGIFMTESKYVQIFRNNITNPDMGIALLQASNNSIFDNHIEDSRDTGVYMFYQCYYNVVRNNTIISPNWHGVHLYGFVDYNLIFNNTVINGSQSGVYIQGEYFGADRPCYYNNISYNYLVNNSGNGVYLQYNVFYTYIIGNTIDNNSKNGVELSGDFSAPWQPVQNNFIENNTIKRNMRDGIYINYRSDGTYIKNNLIEENLLSGIRMFAWPSVSARYHTILNNSIKFNQQHGIHFDWNFDYNEIINNTIENNTLNGIQIEDDCNDNNITGNTFKDNTIGVSIETGSNNIVYKNFFNGNLVNNSMDNGTGNQWDYGGTGNVWSDYSSVDLNDDGRGDTPYNVSGTANAKDNYPIFEDGDDSAAPVLTILAPQAGQFVSTIAPNFQISTDSLYIDTKWYGIIGGSTNYSFIGLSGQLNQTLWNEFVNGSLAIRFYANDSLGNLGFSEVNVFKDVYDPNITILSPPSYQLFGNMTINFTLSIDEPNLNTTWYSLNSGANYTFSGLTGTINQAAWDGCGNGSVLLTFYANDTAGNLDVKQVYVYRDIYPPNITIIEPIVNGLHGNTSITFIVVIDEPNYNTTWYSLNGGANYIFTNNGTLNQSAWDACGNGTVTIRFYANDSVGNWVFKEVSVFKDNSTPQIQIIAPQPFELYGNATIAFNISIIEGNLNITWYSLNGGANYTFLGNTGTLNQTGWDACGNGTVIIIFYANDSLGNMASEQVIVRKDTIVPDIKIIAPGSGEIFGLTAPNFTVEINETNIDLMWYSLNGVANQSFLTNETFRQDWWAALPNGTLLITFSANDTLGNMASISISVWVDVLTPVITINSPLPNEFFNDTGPSFNIFVNETHLNTTWYSLNGGVNITFASNGTFDPVQWSLQPDGAVIIDFYANDTYKNFATVQLTVYKDSISPTIQINAPVPNQNCSIFGPSFNVVIIDPNLNSTWYSLNGGVNITFIGNGSIDLGNWTALSQGPVIIRFYANDSAGNVSVAQVTVIKDSIYPTISIISPVGGDLFGTIAPSFIVEINDTNLDTMWYTLNGGPNQPFLSNETFRQDWWNLLPNGTIIIAFYGNDSAANEIFAFAIVRLDIVAPNLTILAPLANQVFENNPNFNIWRYDINMINYSWYTINSGVVKYFFTNNDTINSTAWNGLLDGPATISFYANDTVGNNNSMSVIIIKDTIAPNITIDSPTPNDYVEIDAPTFSLTISDLSLNSTWYRIWDGNIWSANHTFNGTSGTINQTVWKPIWSSLSHDDKITIQFFANDSFGRESNATVQLRKYYIPGGNGLPPPDDFIIIIIIIIGAVGGGILIGITVIIKKKSGYKASDKETKKIERLWE